MTHNYLRCCAACNAFLLTNDPTSQSVWCDRHGPGPFEEWAASLKTGDRVYLQPYAAWRGLSHSQYLIVGRDGDGLIVQVLGIPESRMQVNIAHCGQHDLTPLPQTGALW